MNSAFGPWATAIHNGSNPQLSTFWRRRLNRLSSVSRSTAGLSQPVIIILGLTALAMGGIPTFAGRAVSQEAEVPVVAVAPAATGPAAAKTPPRVAKASTSRIAIDVRFVGGDTGELQRVGANGRLCLPAVVRHPAAAAARIPHRPPRRIPSPLGHGPWIRP